MKPKPIKPTRTGLVAMTVCARYHAAGRVRDGDVPAFARCCDGQYGAFRDWQSGASVMEGKLHCLGMTERHSAPACFLAWASPSVIMRT
jgi:hypothetical protein